MKIYHQSVFNKWPFEDKSIQAIITSPPFWSLRKYSIPDVVIGDNRDCDHEFEIEEITRETGQQGAYGRGSDKTTIFKENYQQGFCVHCNAWKGQHGLEPDFKLYIEHIRLWAKEAWRVLRDDGIFFLNLGDSYVGGGRGHDNKFGNGRDNQPESWKGDNDIKPKCKLLIPHRVAISLIDDNWILRNDLVWSKKNAMPESCQDRFSKKFEYIFMFVKAQKYYFDLDAVKEQTITKDNITRDRDQGKLNNVPGRSRMAGLTENKYDYKNPGDIWEINTQPSPHEHYAMWPEKLVKRMILCSTKTGDAVLDPFCGSSTTGRVATELDRGYTGIDLGYKSIQEKRMSNIQKELNYDQTNNIVTF